MAMLPSKQMTDELADKLTHAIGNCMQRISKHKHLESVVSLSTHTAETQDALTLANHINTQHAHCLAMQLVKQLEAFSSEPTPGADGRTYRAQVVVIPEEDLNFLQSFLCELQQIVNQSKSLSGQLDDLTKMQQQMIKTLYDMDSQKLIMPTVPKPPKPPTLGKALEPYDRAIEVLARLDLENMDMMRVEEMYRKYLNMHPDQELHSYDLANIATALELAKRRKAEEKR